MTSVLDTKIIIQELIIKLRNSDIFTTTIRGVSTITDTGSIDGLTYTINLPDIKNIRSIHLNGNAITYLKDYTVDYNSGSNCIITFPTIVTGTIVVVYDHGSDKIWPGYPRQDLSINSFPQIAVEFININTEDAGFGNSNINTYDISIVVYAFNKEDVRDYIKAIRSFIINNMVGFQMMRLVKPTLIGPLVVQDFEKFKNRVFKQNIDFNSRLNLEVNN
jgi:hypothetical protein